jgi:FixJ family two-component response regulator
MSVKAMKGGAVDLLTKPVDGKDFLRAIQRAVARDVQDRAAEIQGREIQERVKTLTARETEVFALAVTGMLNNRSSPSSASPRRRSRYTPPG